MRPLTNEFPGCTASTARMVWPRCLLALPLLMLPACSDPDPGITAEEFYTRAGATSEGYRPPGPNGWDRLAEVLDLHGSITDALAEPLLDADADPDTWPAMQIDAICFGAFPRTGLENGLALLDRLGADGVFERLETALAAPRLAQPWDTSIDVNDNLSAGMAQAGKARSLLKTLRARVRVAAAAGDSPTVVRTFEQQLALSRAIAGRCLSLDYLLGVAGVTMTLQDARHLVLEEALSPDAIRGLLAALETSPLLPPAAAVIDTERDFALATFVETAREQGIRVKRSEWIADIESAHAEAAAHLAEPRRGRIAELDQGRFFGAVMAGVSSREESIRLLEQSFAMILDNERRLGLDLAATRAVLLLALHRAEHGTYPATLAEVDAPIDPVAQTPFAYRPTPGDPAAPFILYSVGADGEDNGGVERQAEMLNAPGPDDAGFDCRFTNPRRPYVGFDEAARGGGPGEE